jgi:hypothetical protein
MVRIKLIPVTLLFLLTLPYALGAKNYQSAGTGYIGGVTLFDEANPMLGLNNPGLLNNYGKNTLNPNSIWIDDDYQNSSIDDGEDKPPFDYLDATIDPRVYAPSFSFGRLFILNVFASTMVSEDTIYQSSYFMDMMRGSLTNSGMDQAFLQPLVSAFTFGMIDITPLYSTAPLTTIDQISNIIQIAKNDKIGFAAEINVNVLSYYRHHFGITFYVSTDTRIGFFGDNKNLLLVDDPVVDLNAQVGLAFAMGVGQVDFPLVGKMFLGYTVRAFVEIQGHTDTIGDALTMYEQITNYANAAQKGDFLNFSAFGDGSLARGGFGLALDFGFYKPVTSQFIVAGKLSDILSPRYWLKSGVSDAFFGWKLPDLSLGFRYIIPLDKSIWFIINEPSFYFQFDDLFYTYPISFLGKIHAGFDTKFLFDILHIGFGLNSGYPTLGFTVHLTPMILAEIPVIKYIFLWIPVTYLHVKIHFSLFGKELGRYPGEFGFQGYNIAAEVYLGI